MEYETVQDSWTWSQGLTAPETGDIRLSSSKISPPSSLLHQKSEQPSKPRAKTRRATMHHLSPGHVRSRSRSGSPSNLSAVPNNYAPSRSPSPSADAQQSLSYPYSYSYPPRSPHQASHSISGIPTHSSHGLSSDVKPTGLQSSPNPSSLFQRLVQSFDTQTSWLVLYFFCNLSLTLYNKSVLVRFPFPYTLTALHALCGSIGGYALLEQGMFEPKQLSREENIVLLGFSVLYTVNIAVSNLSLGLVTVPFHQVVRSTTPVFAMMISFVLLRSRFSSKKILSLVPVIAGVGLATYGDYYFTAWGLILTLIGTFLAALKTVLTNVLQTPKPLINGGLSPPSSTFSTPRLHLHPLDLLTRMSPLAFIQCVVFAYVSGELDRVRQHSAHEMTRYKAWALLMNGILAFCLNIVSFTANKKVGALSMTVAANVKQVLTIVFAVSLFDLRITLVNSTGILFTLIGGAWYAAIEYKEKQQRKMRLTTAGTS